MEIKRTLRTGFSALGLLALAACASSTGVDKVAKQDDSALFSAERIRADITFLADDAMNGRDTGSEEYRIAANYVAAEFARLGLKPMGNNGGYFQEVPFRKAKLDKDKAFMSMTIGGETKVLDLGDDYFMSGDVRMPAGATEGDIVFVGYGIHAPELGHDDLAGLDLKGKVALVISGSPKSFDTEVGAYHGSSATKRASLAEAGATGVLFFNSAAQEKRRPFARYKRYLGMENFDWTMPEGVADNEANVEVGAAISQDVARSILAASEKSLDIILAEAEEGSPKGFPVNAKVSMKRDSILSEPFTSPNVLGVIEGSDPTLKNEYVVLSAHLDHIGLSKHGDEADKINNGALDNASGVAVMMEVARAYARDGRKPRRSLLFAAVVAEEKGLLGAEYFAKFPTVEKSQMVADVNLDMPVLLYDFSDVIAFGADHSSLGPVTAAAAGKIGITLSPDPMPEEGIFTRSDHYRFVQQGIPSVFLVTGWEMTTKGEDGGAIFREFLGKTYHSPRDQIDQGIDFQAGAKFAYVNWLITNAIANADERPTWNEGDFFGKVFGGK